MSDAAVPAPPADDEPAEPLALPDPHTKSAGCPGCGQKTTTVALTTLATSHEVCSCAQAEFTHLVERTWHRGCLVAGRAGVSPQPEITRQQAETIAELRRLHEAATPGPWELDASIVSGEYHDPPERWAHLSWAAYPKDADPEHEWALAGADDNDPNQAQLNAELIVAMRNALPDLLAVWALLADGATPRGDVVQTSHGREETRQADGATPAGPASLCPFDHENCVAPDCPCFCHVGATPAEDDQP